MEFKISLEFMKARKLVAIWLLLCCFLVVAMVILGGYTRLSEAGLSIVRWEPISGIFPPSTDLEWENELYLYSQFPEFKEKNFDIGIEKFKRIYMIEYSHRLLGRFLGLLFLLPFLYFSWKKYFTKIDVMFFSILFFLGAGQGFLGWYMVSSGLILNPDVSQYRLAAHMIIAVTIYGLLFWQFMRFWYGCTMLTHNKWCVLHTLILLILCVIQIGLGAFVAGLNAGLIYNTFPLMNGRIIPEELHTLFSISIFDDPASVQFLHRVFAAILIIYGFFFFRNASNFGSEDSKITYSIKLLYLAICSQFILGIVTLVRKVPINLALIHQFLAIVIFTNLLFVLYLLVYRISPTKTSLVR